MKRRHFRNALNTNRYSLRNEIVTLFNKYENRPNCLIRIKIDKIFSELKRESFEHETANNAFRTRTDYTVAIQWKLLIQGNSCLYHSMLCQLRPQARWHLFCRKKREMSRPNHIQYHVIRKCSKPICVFSANKTMGSEWFYPRIFLPSDKVLYYDGKRTFFDPKPHRSNKSDTNRILNKLIE